MFRFDDRYCFGGSGLKNSHAKTLRPLSSKSALHVVMKRSEASRLGKRVPALASKERVLKHTALKLGKKFNVKIYSVRAGSSDIQLLLRFTKRREFQNFLRAFAGLIARKFLRAERGRGQGVKFWAQRPFTRILSWGPQFNLCRKTLTGSSPVKAFGFLSYKKVEALGFKQLHSCILNDLRNTFGYA